MLSLNTIYLSQQKYGVSVTQLSDKDRINYGLYLANCRNYISDKTPADYFNWERQKQISFSETLIIQYVTGNEKEVDGFITDTGEFLITELIDRLKTDIIDFGILRKALDDDEVQEIQINDYKSIWIVKNGKSMIYTDDLGKPYQFVSDDELHATIDRLVFNNKSGAQSARMTTENPLLNTRTSNNGFRVSGVNHSAVTPDMRVGFDFPVTTITIRKYAPSRLTFSDFIENGTLTEEMAQFLKICGGSNIKLACVGPTSSGKTTLLNAIVWEIPKEQRLILIQNPTEIMVYERSEETGTNLRNTVHWEASDLSAKAQGEPTTPTMSNFIAHSLRNTPDVIIPGEVRTPEEFFQMNRALKTGHRVLTTFHATDGADAIERMATELATLGGSIQDYVSSLVRSLDIIVTQIKFPDGKRRVSSIEELTGGVDKNGRAETRVLFKFELSGVTDRDEYGNITNVHGEFKKVSSISDSLVQKFYQSGVSREELLPFISGTDASGKYEASDQAYKGMSLDDFNAGLDMVSHTLEGELI